nr:MAG TPA: hypothetical protein [Caudoviricetes sp.]
MPVICILTYSTSHCRCQIHSAPYAFPIILLRGKR